MVITKIDNLPHYHGGQWNAMFREVFRSIISAESSMGEMNIWIIPTDGGVSSYNPGDRIVIGLTFPSAIRQKVHNVLSSIETGNYTGHFIPNITVRLQSIISRVTGLPWQIDTDNDYLSEEVIKPEIEKIMKSHKISLLFYTPYRAARPEGTKTPGHSYIDDDYFKTIPFDIKNAFLQKSRLLPEFKTFESIDFEIEKSGFRFIDCNYGKRINEKNFGGIVGLITLKGKPDYFTALYLIISQYTGLGKNPSFGLGFYTLLETDDVTKVKRLNRIDPLIEKCITTEHLMSALMMLKETSAPGPDGLIPSDIKRGGDKFFKEIADLVVVNKYKFSGFKKGYIPKSDGTVRQIEIYNVKDKMIHKAIASYISPVIERLLAKSSHAFRSGMGIRTASDTVKRYISEGYVKGLKADISHFFESVDIDYLVCILYGIFGGDPLVRLIRDWLYFIQSKGINGLSQGSSLSPLLSNLYIDEFDRDIENIGCKLVRYADDFIILVKSDAEDVTESSIDAVLSKYSLKLNREKTVKIIEGKEISFLGYIINDEKIIRNNTDDERDGTSDWMPVFSEHWKKGVPVYLTSITRGAFSNIGYLIVSYGNEKERIPWNNISRIVCVGKASFSSGIIYTAVKNNIPISFVDVIGTIRGALYPDIYEKYELVKLQEHFRDNTEATISVAKNIISSKIHNSGMLLKKFNIDDYNHEGYARSVMNCVSPEELRGYEGVAAAEYFRRFATLVSPFIFENRVYHPPDNEINALLSFGYTLIYHRLTDALKVRGFDTRLGFFHAERGRHAALSSDLMEEVRFIIDYFVIQMIRSGYITKESFIQYKFKDKFIYRLSGNGFRMFIRYFENMMRSSLIYQNKSFSINGYIDEIADRFYSFLKLNIEYQTLKVVPNDINYML